MSEHTTLGKYLKERRSEMGLTQAELAEKLKGVHVQFVSNWERGLCSPPLHSLDRLIGILKLSKPKLVDAMLKDSRQLIEDRVYKRKQTYKSSS